MGAKQSSELAKESARSVIARKNLIKDEELPKVAQNVIKSSQNTSSSSMEAQHSPQVVVSVPNVDPTKTDLVMQKEILDKISKWTVKSSAVVSLCEHHVCYL